MSSPPRNDVMRQSDGVDLKYHFSRLLEEMDKRYEQRFRGQECATNSALASAQLAVDKAEANTREWQRNSNEWRAAMSDREKTFASQSAVKKIEEELKGLATVRDIAIGKASQSSVLWVGLLSVAALVVSIVRIFVR